MPPRAKAAKGGKGDEDEGAAGGGGWSRPQDVTRRFQRLVRTFAEALYFKELADVVGQEQTTSDDERRVLGLFMLSAWHGERQLTAEEVVQHRAHATERKRREIEFLSPDGNPAHLCNFTGVARGMSVALRRQFTADEFKAVVVEFDSKAGKHKGVSGLNVDRLEALLASKGVTLDQFTAAMFTSVLNPERFCALKANIAEVKAKVDEKEREREAKRRKTSGEEDAPAPAKPKPKPKQPVVEKEAPAPRASRQRRAPSSDAAAAPPEATPAVAKPLRVAVQEPQLCLYDSVMPTPTALGAAPSAELIDSPLSFLETMKQVATKVQAANEEATLLFSEDPEVYSEDPVVASAKLGAELGLVIPLGAATSWERPGLAATPSVGGALGPASSALGRLPSLGLAPSTSAMQGMLMAMAHPELSLPALQHHAAECAPAATAMYGALGPAVSEWIPASISGASTAPSGGLAPATSASATFATISLARTTSLQRSGGSGGAAFLIPEGARVELGRVEDLVSLSRKPDLDEAMFNTYFADERIDLKPLERSMSAAVGEPMSAEEVVGMLGLFRTLSVRTPADPK